MKKTKHFFFNINHSPADSVAIVVPSFLQKTSTESASTLLMMTTLRGQAAVSLDDMEMSVVDEEEEETRNNDDDFPQGDGDPPDSPEPGEIRPESFSETTASAAATEGQLRSVVVDEEGEIRAATPSSTTTTPRGGGSGSSDSSTGSRCCWVCQVDLKFADPTLVCWYATHPHPYLPGIPVCIACSHETATADVCASCFGKKKHPHHSGPDGETDGDKTTTTTTLVLCDSCPNEYCVECLKVRVVWVHV
jgi:hypothetical protein